MPPKRYGKLKNHERVMEQCEITGNVQQMPDTEERRDNDTSKLIDKEYVYPGGANLHLHDPLEGDLFWGFTRDALAALSHSQTSLFDNADSCFVVLNGLNVAAFGNSQHLQNALYPGGICKAAQGGTVSDVANNNLKSSALYGTRSINNLVVEQGFPGDYLIQCCPDVLNPKELEEYNHGSLGISGAMKERLTPVLKVFDFKEIRHLETILAMKAIELNTTLPNEPYQEIPSNSIDFTPEDHAASNLQYTIMSQVFSLLSVLVDRGIVSVHAKLDKNGKFQFDPSIPGNGTIDLNALVSNQTKHTASELEDLKYENDSEVRYGKMMNDISFFKRREDDMQFLASILGLVETPFLKSKDTSTVRSDILRACFVGSTEDDLYMPLVGGILEELMEGDTKTEKIIGSKDPIPSINNYIRSMENIPHNLHQVASYLNKVTAGKIIGTTITGARFGQPLVQFMTNVTSYRY